MVLKCDICKIRKDGNGNEVLMDEINNDFVRLIQLPIEDGEFSWIKFQN